MSDGLVLLVVGGLLTVGLAASMLAGCLRVPGLVLVLGLGMAIGSDGLGWIAFNDNRLARGAVPVALATFPVISGCRTAVSSSPSSSSRCSSRRWFRA